MTSDAAIRVRGLGKRYRVWTHARPTSLSDRVEAIADAIRRRDGHERHQQSSEIWALRNVTFDVRHGEVLGIVGPNGAGKSTLLSILARITEPTEGTAEIFGRVSSLLEVGTGFHPELSGRDNVFLNGAILGMSRRETAEKFDQIVDFSGVGEFIDMPVKRYSSGMHVRLAFSVAAHLDPEVLLLDEVLAVGDNAFQQKCMRRIDELTQSGRTVVFVSHTPAAVAQLCHRAVVINHGSLVFEGDVAEALERYLDSPQIDGGPSATQQQQSERAGDGRVRIAEARAGAGPLASGEPVRLEVDLVPAMPLGYGRTGVGATIWSPTAGDLLALDWPRIEAAAAEALAAGVPCTLVCEVEQLPLSAGHYFLELAVTQDGVLLDSVRQSVQLQVEAADATLPERDAPRAPVAAPYRWSLDTADGADIADGDLRGLERRAFS